MRSTPEPFTFWSHLSIIFGIGGIITLFATCSQPQIQPNYTQVMSLTLLALSHWARGNHFRKLWKEGL